MEDEFNEFEDNARTGDKRDAEYKVGPYKPPLETRFSETFQRTEEQEKRRLESLRKTIDMRAAFRELLQSPYRLPAGVKQKMIELFGEEFVNEMSTKAGLLVHAQQINKAILKQDTNAATYVMNQAHGMPKQVTELTGPQGAALFEGKTVEELKKLADDIEEKLND